MIIIIIRTTRIQERVLKPSQRALGRPRPRFRPLALVARCVWVFSWTITLAHIEGVRARGQPAFISWNNNCSDPHGTSLARCERSLASLFLSQPYELDAFINRRAVGFGLATFQIAFPPDVPFSRPIVQATTDPARRLPELSWHRRRRAQEKIR